jgi:hypothetical protein
VDWFPELHGERTKRLFSKDQYARLVEALEDALGYDDDSEIARKFLKQEDYESLHKIIIYHQITLRDRGALDRWLDGTGETYHDKLVVRRCQFVNGLLHGYYTVFSSGAVRSVCEFVNGKRHGGAATFYRDDSRSEAVFHEDEIVGEIEYDRNNNVTKKHFYKEGHKLLTQHFKGTTIIKEERFY